MSNKLACVFTGCLALLLAIFFKESIENLTSKFLKNNDISLSLEKDVIQSWKKLVQLPSRNLNRNLRITIGMNTNTDLILNGPELFNQLKITSEESKNCQYITSLGNFKECFGYFFQKGSAAERFFLEKKDFDTVIEATEYIDKQLFIGGNAGLMAESISTKLADTDIYLVGPVGPLLKSLLNKKIIVPRLIEKDEVHLILEYAANELFEQLKAPTANRFIVSHDVYNSQMKLLDDFFDIINAYEPDLIILSGLHLLESQTHDVRINKLESLTKHLSHNSEIKNVIHLELASIGDHEFMKAILDINLFYHINSLGLNEQELLYLAHTSSEAPHSDYFNKLSGQPEISKVTDILHWILSKFGKSLSNPYSRLTRIHFHCLTYHIIVVKDEGSWSNTASSLMAGSKIASKQACGLDFHDQKNEEHLDELIQFKLKHQLDNHVSNSIKLKLTEENSEYVQFNAADPVIEFWRGENRFYFTPVMICKKPVKTVGLGDAISSIGLVYSLFNHPT